MYLGETNACFPSTWILKSGDKLAVQVWGVPPLEIRSDLDIKPSAYPSLPTMCFPITFLPAKLVWSLWIFLRNWSIVDLQCCVSFRCTAKWFVYIYIYIYIYIYSFIKIHFHCSLLQDIEYSSLCYTVNPCCLSVLYMVVCIG